ncbi:pentapeptide repeat-containing protein [Microtetraspora malaysiensis]|uniref:Pentapeptide repeat-containing protein n=1 Tax=Microtetraspora malaysiensis TaxID=161358 RepID=A0ABW6T4L1_9ACTN
MIDKASPKQLLNSLRLYTTVKQQVFDGQDLASLRPRQLWFVRCSFVGVDLRHSVLDGCSFKLCDLSMAHLRGASLRGVSLAGCNLRAADLRDTDLTAAQFSSVNTGTPPHGLTDVTDAKFDNAITRDMQLEQVIGIPSGLSDVFSSRWTRTSGLCLTGTGTLVQICG